MVAKMALQGTPAHPQLFGGLLHGEDGAEGHAYLTAVTYQRTSPSSPATTPMA